MLHLDLHDPKVRVTSRPKAGEVRLSVEHSGTYVEVSFDAGTADLIARAISAAVRDVSLFSGEPIDEKKRVKDACRWALYR